MLVIFAFCFFLAIHPANSDELLQKQLSLWLLSRITVVSFQSKFDGSFSYFADYNTMTLPLYNPQFQVPSFPLFSISESSSEAEAMLPTQSDTEKSQWCLIIKIHSLVYSCI